MEAGCAPGPRADVPRAAGARARTLLAGALVLLAAAAAAALIPFIGATIAAGFFAAASVVLAAYVFVLGMLSAAVRLARGLAQASREARENEAQKRDAVLTKCPAQEAAACFATPSPC